MVRTIRWVSGRIEGAWLEVTALRFGKVQLRLSVVRALVVGLTFWACVHWLGAAAAAPITTAAFLVGTVDTTGSPRRARLWMTLCTVFLTAVTACAVALRDHHDALIALLIVLAFLAGVMGGVTPKATQILCYCALLAATYAIASPARGLMVTAGILLAGLVQTLACALLIRAIHHEPEVMAVRRAIADTSALCAAQTEPERDRIMAQSIQSLYQAELMLADTDLDQPVRGKLDDIVSMLGQLWLGIRGDFLRSGSGAPWPSHDSEQSWLGLFGTYVEKLPPSPRVRQLGADEFWERLARACSPRSEAFAVGTRLVLGVVAGLAAALALGLPYPAWVIAITVMSLRQDMGPTIPLALSRVLGTLVAVALIIPVAFVVGHRIWIYTPLIEVAAFLSFYLLSVNLIALFAMFAATVVFILAASGQDPAAAVIDRLVDITVGSLLALIIAYLLPLWTRRKVRQTISNYAEMTADWADLAFGGGTGPDRLAVAGRQVRAARNAAEAALAAAAHEPEAQHVPLPALRQIVNHLTAVNAKLVAAQDDSSTTEPSREDVDAVVTNLRGIGAELMAAEHHGSPPLLPVDGDGHPVGAAADISAVAVLATRELPAIPVRRGWPGLAD